MKKSILKGTCVALLIASTFALATGCNRDLKVEFESNASDYVKVGQYKGIQISVDEEAIVKDYVDKKVQSDLDSVTTYTAVDRGAQAEDQITVTFTGTIGGEQIDGFSSDSYSLILGKDSFTIPGFTDALYGLKKGDTKVVILTVPTPFTDEPEYAGKRIVYNITVTNVEVPVAPQITDAYAKEYFNFNTVAEYKASLQAGMQKEIDKEINAKKKQSAMITIQNNTEVLGYPEDVLNKKKEDLNKSISFYSTMYQMSVEEYCQSRFGLSFDDYAKKSVVQDLILQDIVKKENLTISEYDYKANLDSFAEAQGFTNPETFVEKYGKELIVRNMLIQEAVDVVLNNAEYKSN